MTEKTAKPEKKVIDWDSVETHYRAGIRSLNDIGSEFGCSGVAVLKHARKCGWERAPATFVKRVMVTVGEARSKEDRPKSGFIYVIFMETGADRFCKIGKASSFIDRLSNLQVSSPFPLHVAMCFFVGDARMEESALHTHFAAKRVRGEWFNLSDEDLRFIGSRALLV